MVTFPACLNRTKRNTQLTLALLSILFVSIVALAQVLYGSIVGTVTDPNGAAVSGAKVELTNVATGAVSSTKTDDSGAYKINDLRLARIR